MAALRRNCKPIFFPVGTITEFLWLAKVTTISEENVNMSEFFVFCSLNLWLWSSDQELWPPNNSLHIFFVPFSIIWMPVSKIFHPKLKIKRNLLFWSMWNAKTDTSDSILCQNFIRILLNKLWRSRIVE